MAATSPDDVFLNCPFDADYAPIFEAIVFTIYGCRFRPRSALEMDDASETRIDKLYRLIEQCRYGVHDLSRTELDPEHGLPRFNMPLELGLFLGAKRFGDEAQRLKRCLVLDVERYRYQKFISDLNGVDIQDHGGAPERAIARTRDWLATVSRRKLAGGQRVTKAYEAFRADLPALAAAADLEAGGLAYVDYETLVVGWLAEADPLVLQQ